MVLLSGVVVSMVAQLIYGGRVCLAKLAPGRVRKMHGVMPSTWLSL